MKESPSEVFYEFKTLHWLTTQKVWIQYSSVVWKEGPLLKSLQRSSIDRKNFRGCQRMEDPLEVLYTFKTPQLASIDKRPFIGIP